MTHQPKLYAQGDVLIERIEHHTPSDKARNMPRDDDGSLVLARGELSGHRHLILEESAQLFREPGFLGSTDFKDNYVGHLTVSEHSAVRHEEHHTITLPPGTYVVRRQRIFDASSSVPRALLAGD